MRYRMLRTNSVDEARRTAVDARVAACGGTVRWRAWPHLDRTYALIETPGDAESDALDLEPALALGAPIIALAVSPSVPEALPILADVLGGDGRPAGVTACERIGASVVVEWDLERTPVASILDCIDTELDRFHSGRTTVVLAPLSDAWISRIAAEGLQCPDVAPDRMLEPLLARAGLDG